MHRITIALMAALGAFAATGCNTTTQDIRVPRIGVIAADLDRSEYVILGNTEGNACVEQSCFAFLGCNVKDEAGNEIQVVDENGVPILGGGLGSFDDVSRVAENRAMFAALKTQPDADAVLTPRKSASIETSNAIITSSVKSCVRVFGKSVRIKTDEEIRGGAAPAPTPPPPPPPAAEPAPAAAPAPAPAG